MIFQEVTHLIDQLIGAFAAVELLALPSTELEEYQSTAVMAMAT